MTEGRLHNLEIRKAKRHHGAEHIVIDIGNARAHISLADEQASITAHDGDKQASILLNEDEEITHVVHEDGIGVVEDTTHIRDPMAVTSAE